MTREKINSQTSENYNLLKLQMDGFKEDIQNLKKTIEEKVPTIDQMKLANRELVENVIDKCDKRYAPKSVELGFQKLLWLFIGTPFSIGVAIVVYLITRNSCS